jgi:hypothetical protein
MLERMGVSAPPCTGSRGDVAPDRQDASPDDADELDEVVDEFGDRSGPDPAREPELELGDDEVIVEPASDDEG